MDWSTLWYPVLFSVVVMAIGLIVFQRTQRKFADII
jgi:ABC-type polysaccharide/polyol phosphate export permease